LGIGGKPRVPVLGAEDEVIVQRRKGIGHRFVPFVAGLFGAGNSRRRYATPGVIAGCCSRP
jgi:hypothetical protein